MTARPAHPPKRTRPRRARVREAHAHWIELGALGEPGYVVWKEARPGADAHVLVGEATDGRPVADSYEFEFTVAELELAVNEATGLRKLRGADPDDDEAYGDGVAVGGGRGLDLERRDRSLYAFVAPCGDGLELTGAELRLLVAGIRELPETGIS